MTQKESICKIADFCGQRVEDNPRDIERPYIIKADIGWECNRNIQFGVVYGIIDIYVYDNKRWFILTFEDDKYYLQENHENGDITYFVDGAKSIRAIYNAIRKQIPQAVNF